MFYYTSFNYRGCSRTREHWYRVICLKKGLLLHFFPLTCCIAVEITQCPCTASDIAVSTANTEDMTLSPCIAINFTVLPTTVENARPPIQLRTLLSLPTLPACHSPSCFVVHAAFLVCSRKQLYFFHWLCYLQSAIRAAMLEKVPIYSFQQPCQGHKSI